MAENDNENEEYSFGEFDSMEPGSMEPGSMEEGFEGTKNREVASEGVSEEKVNVKRNAMIVAGVIFGIFVLYKIVGSMFGGTKAPVKPEIPSIAQTAPQPVQQAALVPAPITPAPTIVKEADTELKQKVSNIESNEQNIKNDVSSLKDQINTVDNNINNLNAQLAKLNQAVTDLSSQLAKQSMVISLLTEKAKRKAYRPKKQYVYVQPIKYNIQAVIPGRAWLIGSNGSTLTVREGTIVKGYGEVRLIDSIQGRVIMSSGRIIRFSQDDS